MDDVHFVRFVPKTQIWKIESDHSNAEDRFHDLITMDIFWHILYNWVSYYVLLIDLCFMFIQHERALIGETQDILIEQDELQLRQATIHLG